MQYPDPDAMFGVDSVSWRMNSRWTALLGGQAAALLQVAHPSVGAGVAQHSDYKGDPLGRLVRTLDAMLAISFGSPQRRSEVLAALAGVHSTVEGDRSDGEPYSALDHGLQLWVWATLVHVASEVERRYVGELSSDDRRRFYIEQRELIAAFGVAEDEIPVDLDAFHSYVASEISKLSVTDEGAAAATGVLRPGVWWIPEPTMVPLRWITADLLPGRLRREFGIPRLRAHERTLLRRLRSGGRLVLPRLPEKALANPRNRLAIG